MPQKYSVSEAKNRLTSILRNVEGGTPIELTRRGEPVAMLLSIGEYRRLTSGKTDFWRAVQTMRSDPEFEPIDDSVFENLRDKSPGRRVEF